MAKYKETTYKLGAYSMSLTLEFFEEQGYVKYKDLDKYFAECYNELETCLDKETFIEESKKSLLRSIKYRQFINNEVKMCNKCFLVKPLDSYYNSKESADGKLWWCKCCERERAKKYAQTEQGKKTRNRITREYARKNKEKVLEMQNAWRKKNKHAAKAIAARTRVKRNLKKYGYIVEDREKLDFIARFKQENDIKYFSDLFKRLEGVLNDYRI